MKTLIREQVTIREGLIIAVRNRVRFGKVRLEDIVEPDLRIVLKGSHKEYKPTQKEWENAIEDLIRDGYVVFDRSKKTYSLAKKKH